MKLLRYLLTLSLLAGSLLGTAANAQEAAATVTPEPEIDGYIVEIDVPVRLLSASDPAFPELSEVYAPANLYQAEDAATVEALRAWGVLRSAEPNYVVTLDDTPTLYGASTPENAAEAALLAVEDLWYTPALEVAWVNSHGVTGNGVRVGIVDSGIFKNHEDFQGVKILDGGNYCVSKTDAKFSDVSDTLGHGTFVSGLIAAAHNNKGLDGLAPDVEIVPLKCFEGKSGSVSNIAQAIYDAVDVWHCQVLNLSLGLERDSAALRKAVEHAHEAGVVMVAAVGNLLSGSHGANGDPLMYPAGYPEVIGVGSVAARYVLSDFSYRNESVELCAPGQNLLGPSCTNATRYVSGYGTSYAAPMVTAAAALTLSARPDMSAADVRELLRNTVRDCGPVGYDTSFGYGALHLGHLLAAALGDAAHQATVIREEFADTDGPTPALFAAAYDENGALLDTLDISPPVKLENEANTTPVLSTGSDEYSEEAFAVEGAARWKLFPFDRVTFAPVRAAVTLYGEGQEYDNTTPNQTNAGTNSNSPGIGGDISKSGATNSNSPGIGGDISKSGNA